MIYVLFLHKDSPSFQLWCGFFSVAETKKSRLNNLPIDITTVKK